jgi:hypothetical protein
MGDKSPKKPNSKKPSRSLKEKRVDKESKRERKSFCRIAQVGAERPLWGVPYRHIGDGRTSLRRVLLGQASD